MDFRKFQLLCESVFNRSDSWDLKNSDKYRREGNLKFNEGKYFPAIIQYNKALICGRKDKIQTSLCFANRSAAYLEIGYFKHCLHNIELAEEHYPRENIQKLHERRQKCLKMMENSDDMAVDAFVHTFKLSYEPNPKLPFFIDSLELKEDSKYGKHLISTRDLKAGDVITVINNPWRDPVNSLVENYAQGCYICHDSNNGDLIPGDCKALFCSETCKSEHQHQSSYHEELNEFETLSPDRRQSSDLKLLMHIHNVFGSVDEMKKFVDEHRDKQYTVFDFDWSDSNDQMYYKNMLLIMLNASEPRDRGVSLDLYRTACSLMFKEDSQLALILNGDVKNDKFLDKILHAILSRSEYVLTACCCDNTFASFFHPSLHLLIPSCKPNVVIHSNRRDIVWTANQPISAGTPITASTSNKLEKDGCFQCSSSDETLVSCKKDESNEEETEIPSDHSKVDSCRVFFEHNDPKILTNWLKYFKCCCDFINENFDKYDEDTKMNLAIKKEMAAEIYKILFFIENPCQPCNPYIPNFNNLDHMLD